MAHHFRVKVQPHHNVDGTVSKTRKDYVVIDRTRKRRRVLGAFSSMKKAEEEIAFQREQILSDHMKKHPNDIHFQKKHGVGL